MRGALLCAEPYYVLSFFGKTCHLLLSPEILFKMLLDIQSILGYKSLN